MIQLADFRLKSAISMAAHQLKRHKGTDLLPNMQVSVYQVYQR